MADGKVVIDTELDQSGINKGMSQVESKAGKIFGGIGKVGISAMKGIAVGVSAVSTAIGGLAVSAIKYNASMEQYATSFEVMTGSAEKASEVMERLKDIGAETPFEFEDVADATQKLMSFGMSADEAIDSFGMLGDIAQGDAQKLSSFSLALGKMESSQKVTLESLNMMIENGFNPLTIVAEKTGETMSDLYDRVSDGGVSIDEIKDAMVSATSAGGQFFQSMEKQSETLSGRISTLKDNFQELTGEIFGSATSGAGEIVTLASSWIEQLQVAFTEGGTEGLVTAFGDIIAEIIGRASEFTPHLLDMAVLVIQAFIDGLKENMDQITTGLVSIISSMSSAIIELSPALQEVAFALIISVVKGVAELLPELIPQFVEMSLQMIEFFIQNLPLFTEAGLQLLLGLIEGFLKALPTIIEHLPTIIGGIIDALLEGLPLIVDAGVKLLSALVENIPAITLAIVSVVPKIIEKIVDKFASFAGKIKDIGVDILKGIGEGILSAGNWLMEKVKELCGGVVDGIKDFFGIHSPSALMRDEVGRYIAEGIGVGFEKYNPMKQIVSDINMGMNQLESSIRFDVQQTSQAQAQGLTQYINIQREVNSPDEIARAIRIESKYGLMRGFA